jgi:bifunctional DNA-binding transcriptional regulator/antitoxin component of YhaV-PrlF toxin-antitoxin module
MSDATLDDRGRLTLPKEIREQYGDRYHIVELHDGIKLVPVAEDPLEALRDEFEDVEGTAEELREGARERALDEAGR